MYHYNFINNIQNCYYDVPSLVYYSHIPTGILSLFFCLYIFLKKRDLASKILLSVSIIFNVWLFSSLIVWTSVDSRIIIFFWNSFGITTVLLFLTSVYFLYVFLNKKDIRISTKFFFAIISILTIIFSYFAIKSFDVTNCEAIEKVWYINYYYVFIGSASLFWIIIYSLYKYFKTSIISDKKQIILLMLGLVCFLILFMIAGYFASFLGNYELEQYGLFGMTIFMGFIAYLIVRFKAFNIKLLGAQALVWAMVISIGSQFFFIKSPINMVLNSITFLAVSISGYILIRSVKKVDTQRELLEKANQNQQSLLHFITHQVKGYLTKSRNIFDGILAGDYGEISDQVKEITKHGFESDTRGVETVMAILKASDLKTGKTEFKKEKANISSLVAEVIEFKKDLAVAKNLDLTFDIEPNVYTQVDIIQIKEVFKNLITNSIIYTQNGTVKIILKKENGKIRFSVVDTGVGLSPEDKEKLFTEGGKGKDSVSMNVDSTGYGLYIAKKIVNQHGGKINAKSEGRGKGSEFFVILPDIQ